MKLLALLNQLLPRENGFFNSPGFPDCWGRVSVSDQLPIMLLELSQIS